MLLNNASWAVSLVDTKAEIGERSRRKAGARGLRSAPRLGCPHEEALGHDMAAVVASENLFFAETANAWESVSVTASVNVSGSSAVSEKETFGFFSAKENSVVLWKTNANASRIATSIESASACVGVGKIKTQQRKINKGYLLRRYGW